MEQVDLSKKKRKRTNYSAHINIFESNEYWLHFNKTRFQ